MKCIKFKLKMMQTRNILKKPKNKHIAVILGSAFILTFMALYNGYPYVFNNDTAVYLTQAYQGQVGPSRPIIYGLFMSYLSLGKSLWLVVVVQSLLVSYVIYCYFRYFLSKSTDFSWFIAFVAFITFFMSGSFYAGYLMPDVFAGIGLACLGLLLFAGKMKTGDLIAVSTITVISLAMHNAYIYIFIILLGIALLGYTDKTIREHYRKVGIGLRRFLLILLLVALGHVFSATLHYFHGGEFKSSRGGAVFLMGNMVEMGIIDTYLAENCDEKDLTLCQYRGQIPNNFLWTPESPIHKNGGWEGNKAEYTAIVKDVLTTPGYLMTFIYKSGVYTVKQFFNFDAGPIIGEKICIPAEYVKTTLARYYPGEFSAFSNSRQNREELSFDLLNYVQELIVGVCLFIYLMVLLFKKMEVHYRMFIGFLLIFLVVNAWVFSTFSMVDDRYQSHIIWLLPLPLFLYASEHLSIGKIREKTGN